MLAIDLAKRSFQVCATDRAGSVLYNRAMSRTKLEALLKEHSSCIVAMEACATSHFWGRQAQAAGHEVRLIPPIYVKPFVKRQKNDASDAAAIAEAARRPDIVWSRHLMVHYSARNGSMHYGPDSSRERPHDRGGPSSEQHSQESLRVLAKRHGINQKTVAKWKPRTAVRDLPTGPKDAHSTVLSIEEEAIIVAFRKHTLLPLDDCLYALQATIPRLTRSSLHRCLQRHGISRLPEVAGDKEPKRKFKTYPIGYFHIDIAEVRTAEGKLYLYVAIDRTSKFAFVQLVTKTGRTSACAFLVALIEAVPYKIHTVLTDNGIQFTFQPRYADGLIATYMTHMFDMRCRENGIEHRLTKVRHPWTNGQVERMNRTIKEATVKRYHYDSHAQLTAHLHDFINAYNYGRRLKTLRGLTPYEFICKCWTNEPDRFRLNPHHQMLAPNS